MGTRITTIARAFGISLLAGALVAAAAIVAPAPAQASTYDWTVANKTNQPIWFDMYAQQGSVTSQIVYAKEAPLKPGETGKGTIAYASGFYNLYVWGRYCYAGQTFNLQRKDYGYQGYELVPLANDALGVRVLGGRSADFPVTKTGPC